MLSPTEVRVKPVDLTSQQREWLERAWELVREDELVELITGMVRVPSPTGEEAAISQFMVERMRGFGLEASYQKINELRGNAVGRLRGDGSGPELLFYGHLDTPFSGIPEEDFPMTAGQEHRSLRAEAFVEDGFIGGLGASNPKGPAACEVIATAAVLRAGVPLKGTVTIGHVAGGSQKAQLPGIMRDYFGPRFQGQGAGCEYMLKHGVRADFCVSAKPGYAVSWEEAGDCWIRVRVKGVAGDVSTRGAALYKNPIIDAATLMTELEAWFDEYTRRNTAGQIAPRATVGAIEAGWPYKPPFIPSICDFYVAIRTNPRTELMDVKRQFAAALDDIRARHPGLDVDWDTYLSVPGEMTDPENWIVQSGMRAWERVENRPHTPRVGINSAPDSDVMRRWGIPTARLGADPPTPPPGATPGFLDRIERVSIDLLKRLTRCYIGVIVDTCTRSREEVGLA